jgi:predicted nucleic acid-binding protein
MLVVDAGPLVAAFDSRDRVHRQCVDLLETAAGPLLVPEVVLSEVAYLVGARVGAAAETKLAAALRERELQAVATVPDDWRRVAELVDRYLDLPLGLVDATVVAIAERLSVSRLATLDRRHFSVVRPRHVEGFELVP